MEFAIDERMMRRALRLARRGAGRVSPNPMVGAVVVREGRIVGEGYHRRFGGPHAEVFALDQAGEQARGATLYVTLEPCCYFGKTPPCTDRILAAGIRRVVVAMADPNPKVNGRGLQILRDHGIEVVLGPGAEEARRLNAPFIKLMRTGLPFVTLKIAQTVDGRIADAERASKWITGEPARKRVHRLRAEVDAVLVGVETVLADDPALTVRAVRGRQPYRIVLDSHLRTPLSAQLLNDRFVEKTILFTTNSNASTEKADAVRRCGAGIEPVEAGDDGGLNLQQVLRRLAKRQIGHLLVEGGGAVFSSFLKSGLADRLLVFIAPKIFGAGLAAMELNGFSAHAPLQLRVPRWRRVGEDMLLSAELSDFGADGAQQSSGMKTE